MLRRIFALTMAVLITWSSAGAAIYQHVCRSGDLYEASFTRIDPCEDMEAVKHEVKTCCSESGQSLQSSIGKSDCCDYKTTFNKVEVESQQVKPAGTFLDEVASLIYLPVLVLSTIVSIVPAVTERILCGDFFTQIIIAASGDIHALLQTFRC